MKGQSDERGSRGDVQRKILKLGWGKLDTIYHTRITKEKWGKQPRGEERGEQSAKAWNLEQKDQTKGTQ